MNEQPSRKPYELIGLDNTMTMPSAWSAPDSGESWRWEDLYVIIESGPVSVRAALPTVFKSVSSNWSDPFVYPFVATVFYAPYKNPHGPSKRPIFVVCVEQSDFKSMREQAIRDGRHEIARQVPESGFGAPVLATWLASGRTSIGQLQRPPTLEEFRDLAFKMIATEFHLSETPRKLGMKTEMLKDPAWPKSSTSSAEPRGCAGSALGLVVSICVLLSVFLF